MKLKFAPFCSSRDALSDGILFFQSQKISDFGQKPWAITHGFFSGSPKKVLRKVYRLTGNGKRNLMTLVSVAWHLRVGSYERFKFFIHCTFEWGTNLETKIYCVCVFFCCKELKFHDEHFTDPDASSWEVRE